MNEEAVKQVGPQEAKELIGAGAVLLDVRRADEFAESRIPGSTWIVLDELSQKYGQLPKDRQIVVQCKSGGRSNRAAAWLGSQGYSAVNLAGGIDLWKQEGLPVEPGNPEEV